MIAQMSNIYCEPQYYNAQFCHRMGHGELVVGIIGVIVIFGGGFWFFCVSLDSFFRLMNARRDSKSPEYRRQFSRIRRDVLARDGYRCVVCGAGGRVHVHHRIPRAQGGQNTMSNLVTLCARHHGQIHGRNWH